MNNADKIRDIEPLRRPGTAALIADRIRSAIIDGPFGPGDQLGEAHLAAALGVSRGPVREALQRLIQEGLLHAEPNRGVFVIQLDEGELRDVYYARAIVERAAVLRLLERNDPEDLEELGRRVEEMRRAARKRDAATAARADLRFHKALADATRSKRLIRMFETLIVETRLAIAGGGEAPPLDTEVIEEHARLLEALRAGDRRRALALVEEHMSSGVRRRLISLRESAS